MTNAAADNTALGTGSIAVQGGNLLLDPGVVLANNGVILSAGTTLDANGVHSTLSGIISGSGSLAVTNTTGACVAYMPPGERPRDRLNTPKPINFPRKQW